MKSKTRLIALIASICIIIGICLGTIGFLSNGLEELSNLNKPIKKEKSFDTIKSLHIDLWGHSVDVKESKDNKIHVKYAEFKDTKDNKITIKEKDGALSITEQHDNLSVVQLPLNAISKALSESKYRTHTVTIYLPKGLTLDSLSGYAIHSPLQLQHLHIKDFAFSSYVYGENLTIDSGQISKGYFNNSQIKKVTVTPNESISFDNTTFEDSQFDSGQGWINLENVVLKNTKLVQKDYQELVFKNLTLDNSSIDLYNYSLNLDNLTVKGNSQIHLLANDNYDGFQEDLTIRLSDITKTNLNLDVSITSDTRDFQIFSDKLTNLDKSDRKVSRTVPNSKDKLTITSKLGNISIE